jgi:hypothetical protein
MSEVEADLPYKPTNGTLQDNIDNCYWCGAKFIKDKHDMYTEEVGEFWNKKHQDSVLGHPDCTPRGIDAIQNNEDPEWSMA